MLAEASLLVVVLMALAIEAVAGYPQPLYRRIGHPVTWIGALIAALERGLNRPEWTFNVRKLAGFLALLALVGIPVAVAVIVQHNLKTLLAGPWPWLAIGIEALAASTLLASRSLYTHVRDVAAALDRDGLAGGRIAVARIVGRDPELLDESGVARAAIESLAENASDGVVAPVLWFAVLGLPGLVAYKAINTADSMIGHRSEKYAAFGWASARLDDLVNLPASRVTGALLIAASALQPGGMPLAAATAMWRDAGRHRSPNAGWPESAMAGALGLKLNGPRSYAGQTVDDAYMGDGRRDASGRDIRRALALAVRAWIVMIVLIGGALVLRL